MSQTHYWAFDIVFWNKSWAAFVTIIILIFYPTDEEKSQFREAICFFMHLLYLNN